MIVKYIYLNKKSVSFLHQTKELSSFFSILCILLKQVKLDEFHFLNSNHFIEIFKNLKVRQLSILQSTNTCFILWFFSSWLAEIKSLYKSLYLGFFCVAVQHHVLWLMPFSGLCCSWNWSNLLFITHNLFQEFVQNFYFVSLSRL